MKDILNYRTSQHSQKIKNYAILVGKVIAIGLLGNQKYIYVYYNDMEIVATFRFEIEVKYNSNFELFLNLNKTYFFDKEAEKGFIKNMNN